MGIQSLFIYLTFKCNLKCEHCWAYSGPDVKEDELSLETIKRTINEAYNMGMRSLKLTGGEPLVLKNYVTNIIDLVNNYGDVRLRMETNGVLLDDKMIKLLNDNNIYLSISLHSSKAPKHDQIVGKEGAFDKVISVIPKIKNKEILVTISKKNMDELEDILKLLSSIGANSVKFNILQTVGRGENLDRLTRPDMINIHKRIENYTKENESMEIDTSAPMCTGLYSLNNFYYPKSSKGCNFGSVCCLTPGGNISLCGWSKSKKDSELLLGNIENEKLKDIWKRKELVVKKTEPLEGVCNNCLFLKLCKGGCRAIAYEVYGKLNAPDPICQVMYEEGEFPKSKLIAN